MVKEYHSDWDKPRDAVPDPVEQAAKLAAAARRRDTLFAEARAAGHPENVAHLISVGWSIRGATAAVNAAAEGWPAIDESGDQ